MRARKMSLLWGPRTLQQAGMLAVLLFALALVSGAARVPATQAAPALPLRGPLAADGALALPPDFHGSLDASDRQSVGGAGEPPRLAPLATAGDDKWAANFTLEGVSGPVRALARPLSGQIYAGGSFTVAGNVAARNIAAWNGASWSALGYGLDGEVKALVASGSNIYAGGAFNNICNDATCTSRTPVNYIAVWNGSSWSGLQGGVHGGVWALAASGNNIYVGGLFDKVCDTSACTTGAKVNNIALWNGSAWSALDFGLDSYVYALALYGTTLYAGGSFPHICGDSNCGLGLASVVKYVAKWNGSNWSGVGAGMYDTVRALDVDSFGTVYAGGDFYTVCSPGCAGTPVPVNHVAKFTGGLAWSAVGVGVHGSVYSLNVDASNNVFVGGVFTFICPATDCSMATTGPAAYLVAKWTAAGSSWGAMAGGLHREELGMPPPQVNALLDAGGGSIYVGGDFETAGTISAKHVARWTGAGWDHLAPPSGDGMSSKVYAIAADGSGNVYVGGAFDAAGGVVARGIARWNGSSWSALGFGLSGPVHALAFDGSGNLYAGGEFYQICGNAACDVGDLPTPARYVAKWNATTGWSHLGNGLNNSVYALAWGIDNALYAGGNFTQACDATCVTANRVAKWSSSSWSAVGLGFKDTVYALKFTPSGKLYAGGSFIAPCDDLPCVTTTRKFNRIAQLDSTWAPLLFGVDNTVYALALDGSGNLFIGGEFDFLCNDTNCSAPTAQVNHLAKWTLGAWGTVGNGVDGAVRALAVDSTNALYVGGDLLRTCGNTTCGLTGTAANHIVKRNVSAGTWATLGSGTDGRVNALAIDGRNYLDAGGEFTQAGAKISVFFAQYDLGRILLLPLVMR